MLMFMNMSDVERFWTLIICSGFLTIAGIGKLIHNYRERKAWKKRFSSQAHKKEKVPPKAINSMPEKQAKRIYAHFFLGMSKAEIARIEGVSKSAVTHSIEQGLKSIEKFLKNNSW